jgi:formamidopyrimidine-DNA glycosylase
MPELPEVETVRCGLEGAIKGSTIRKVTLRRKDLRIPFPPLFAEILEGQPIRSVERRAKYLLFGIGKDDVLIAHLGMTGRFSVQTAMPKQFSPHDHVVIELKDGRVMLYNDARRFGLMTLVKRADLQAHKLLSALGPEPLEKEFSAKYLKSELLKRNTPIKVAIMDQQLVVGVGNIYASEALFLSGIDPHRPAKSVADRSADLIKSIRKVLGDAIASGGSSLRDFVQVSGEAGYFQHHFNVYGRQEKPCFTCGTAIRSTRMGGRSTFFCAHCQS